jgi:antitoxin (DNA-binding transcriptional repressor) of toxin-antitoxin stability system
MKSVTMLQFRRHAHAVLKQVGQGRAFVLTHRGKPVARLEPVTAPIDLASDPIYRLADLASDNLAPLSNAEIDRELYGP